MLRESAHTARVALNLTAIGAPGANPGREDAAALLAFTDALVGDWAGRLAAARRHLVAVLGAPAVAPAAATAGNFEMMNRVVDATGVPVPARLAAVAAELALPPLSDR